MQSESLFLDLPVMLWLSTFFSLSLYAGGAQNIKIDCGTLSQQNTIALMHCKFYFLLCSNSLSLEEWRYELFTFLSASHLLWHGSVVPCIWDLTDDLQGKFSIAKICSWLFVWWRAFCASSYLCGLFNVGQSSIVLWADEFLWINVIWTQFLNVVTQVPFLITLVFPSKPKKNPGQL